MEKTLCILKPDAVRRGMVGRILAMLEEAGFQILRMELVHLTAERAKEFYAVHAERPFYGELVEYMTSGPCVPVMLGGDHAVPRLREVMGATNPKEAAFGTIRARFGVDIQTNSVHGSDSPENARKELEFFFPGA